MRVVSGAALRRMRGIAGALVIALCPHEHGAAEERKAADPLPAPVAVEGVVEDSAGRRLAGVELVFVISKDAAPRVKTDHAGQFRLQTTAPVLLFRKAGFLSVRVETEAQRNYRIRMEAIHRGIPVCSPDLQVRCLVLSHIGRFCVPVTEGITALPAGRVASCYERAFVTPEDPAQQMKHGGGIQWGLGFPPRVEIWQSQEYSEAVYPTSRTSVMDARGRTAGGLWRQLLVFGESLEYRDLTPHAAALFDAAIDKVCLMDP